MAEQRTYNSTQVENGLLLLHQQMMEEFDKLVPRFFDVVCSYVPEGQQRFAQKVVGMPLERIRVDVLGMVLKGLPEGVPDEEEKAQDEGPGYFA